MCRLVAPAETHVVPNTPAPAPRLISSFVVEGEDLLESSTYRDGPLPMAPFACAVVEASFSAVFNWSSGRWIPAMHPGELALPTMAIFTWE